jgi:DNA-binding response OmpR family regulator
MNGQFGPHVLALDDAQAMLDLLRDLLEEEGYRVSAARFLLGPDEVAEIAPDLIVVDLVFNEEPSGLDWLCRVRRDQRLKTIPVVVCTAADALARDLSVDRRCGEVVVVAKPFDLDELVDQISAQLRASPRVA